MKTHIRNILDSKLALILIGVSLFRYVQISHCKRVESCFAERSMIKYQLTKHPMFDEK